MVGSFKVIDTMRRHFDKSERGPEQTFHQLCLLDEDPIAPMRQMPRYTLDPDQGEVEKFSGGQLNGKSVKIEVREMSGKGNPNIRGRIIQNGAK